MQLPLVPLPHYVEEQSPTKSGCNKKTAVGTQRRENPGHPLRLPVAGCTYSENCCIACLPMLTVGALATYTYIPRRENNSEQIPSRSPQAE